MVKVATIPMKTLRKPRTHIDDQHSVEKGLIISIQREPCIHRRECAFRESAALQDYGRAQVQL